MDIRYLRTWIIFYLICFVALLFAVFLISRNVMLWIGGMIITLVLGFNLILIYEEFKKTGFSGQ